MKRSIMSLCALFIVFLACAQTHISFDDVQHWTANQLRPYVGQTVIFDQPVYTCNNYRSNITASMHRVMSPTNQAAPLSQEYNTLLTVNNAATFTINGLQSDRMGQTIYGLKAKINSTSSVTVVSYDSIWGTREDMAQLPSLAYVDSLGNVTQPDIVVCAANLEYYLTEQFRANNSTAGPANDADHQKQRKKVSAALAKIKADIYGLVEVQQGQGAIAEIAADLTALTGRNYTYINDGSYANGTYTKSGYVYCPDVVQPFGRMLDNNKGVYNRKKFQAFDHIASGERFIYTINHFKAKSGSGSGANADQGDGQGIYNADRIEEAKSVLQLYNQSKGQFGDNDLLIMGDLNAYAMEDPIMELRNGGMTDLHRYFHADSSYSYTYHGTAGYLDHALCNSTMLPQITGMAAYHLNSDENDDYTYNGSRSENTMFRYSDHDPVLVGIKLGANLPLKQTTDIEVISISNVTIDFPNHQPLIKKAENGHFSIVATDGRVFTSGNITSDEYTVDAVLPQGLYIIHIYANGGFKSIKYFVP